MDQVEKKHRVHKPYSKNAENTGRINITSTRAWIKGGTENHYKYNVATGSIYKWMKVFEK
jgi:hypothetical protein